MANLTGWATQTDCDLDLQQQEPKDLIIECGGRVNMRQKKQRGVEGEGQGERRGKFIGGVCTELGNSTGPFLSAVGDTVESLNPVTNRDRSQPRDSIGNLYVFVCLPLRSRLI
jgi:hypothetical protein